MGRLSLIPLVCKIFHKQPIAAGSQQQAELKIRIKCSEDY